MMRTMHHRTTRLMAVSWAPLSIAASFFCGGKRTVQLPALSVDVRGVLGAVLLPSPEGFLRAGHACLSSLPIRLLDQTTSQNRARAICT